MTIDTPAYSDGIQQGKQTRFLGLNHNEGAGDGEIFKMQNLCSDYYPLLATRHKRRLFKTLTKGNGIFAWEKLCWVDGTNFYYDGVLKGQVLDSKKYFCAMSGYIIIGPDMAYYDVVNDSFGHLGSSTGPGGTAQQPGEIVFKDGTIYGEAAEANTIYSATITWGTYFREGDAITISGCSIAANNITVIVREIDGHEMHFYENSFTNGTVADAGIKFERKVPELQGMMENENRLWGYNDQTIYVSKLGDPFNFNVFDGLDTDSFATDTGSAGDIDGCIPFRGYPIYTKEDRIYKVYGSSPSNYEILSSSVLGVAEGSGDSLAVAGDSLLYLNRNGICLHKGGLPTVIAKAFGNERYKNAVAGSDGMKYYVSMEDQADKSHFFVYDTQKGMWHEEDDTKATHFAYAEGNLYFLDDKGKIWITGNIQDPPQSSTLEEDFEWSAEFTDFTDNSTNQKHVAKLSIRLELDKDAYCDIYIMEDSDGTWKQTNPGRITHETKRSYYLAVLPIRADHYRIKLEGKGGCRVYSITREYSYGSPYSRLPSGS